MTEFWKENYFYHCIQDTYDSNAKSISKRMPVWICTHVLLRNKNTNEKRNFKHNIIMCNNTKEYLIFVLTTYDYRSRYNSHEKFLTKDFWRTWRTIFSFTYNKSYTRLTYLDSFFTDINLTILINQIRKYQKCQKCQKCQTQLTIRLFYCTTCTYILSSSKS